MVAAPGTVPDKTTTNHARTHRRSINRASHAGQQKARRRLTLQGIGTINSEGVNHVVRVGDLSFDLVERSAGFIGRLLRESQDHSASSSLTSIMAFTKLGCSRSAANSSGTDDKPRR